MDDLDHLLAQAQAWHGAPLALATVTGTWGSAPRPRGSHMLIHADGRFEGSVSGGCVETDVLHLAAEVIGDGVARSRSYGVSNDQAWSAGLPCGGTISILVQPVADGGFPAGLFQRIATARANGASIVIATDTESGQSHAGAQEGMFLNTYLPPRRILIVGAVQIAQTLVTLARAIGIQPVVIDPRSRFLTGARFPGVTLDDRWPDEAIAACRPDPATAVIVLSHDPKIDDPALAAALRAPTGYIGALGSRKSHASRLERLSASGFSGADLARIDGPVGLDIGAKGAAEIALSIAAGMVKTFNAQP